MIMMAVVMTGDGEPDADSLITVPGNTDSAVLGFHHCYKCPRKRQGRLTGTPD